MGQLHPTEQIPFSLVYNQKLKDPKNLANAFSNFFNLLNN